VKNTGEFDGDEIVQLYIRDELASMSRSIKELNGFQRNSLKDAAKKKITFELDPEKLSMLDKDMNRVVESGDFRIMIGASPKNIRLRSILIVK